MSSAFCSVASSVGRSVVARATGDVVDRLLAPPEKTGLFERLVKQRTVRPGVSVMGDNMLADDMVASAKRLEDLGCDIVIHHIGFDERRGIAASGARMPSPLDQLRAVCDAVSVPVQAVGGLTTEQAIACPSYGAPLVVLGAPLTVDDYAFKSATGNLEEIVRHICERIHAHAG